jgi:hypothetical protein
MFRRVQGSRSAGKSNDLSRFDDADIGKTDQPQRKANFSAGWPDWLIAVPALLLFTVVAAICWPLYALGMFLYRSVCPRCHLPFARRTLSETFDRPNVKFHVNHHKLQCSCRWCGNTWNIEILRDPGY